MRRAVRIEIGGDQLGTADDHAHGGFDQFEVERPSLADDDVIRIVIDDGVAVLMQGRQQSAFADDERRAVRLLLRQEARRGHRAGEDVLVLDLDAHACQLGDDVAAGALAVVGQKAKRDVAHPQFVDELIRAGNQLGAAIENAVHVDQVAVLHKSPPCKNKTTRIIGRLSLGQRIRVVVARVEPV